MSISSETWECAQCGKELTPIDFKIKSLIYKDKWVCEDCALYEDEVWLEHIHSTKSSSIQQTLQ